MRRRPHAALAALAALALAAAPAGAQSLPQPDFNAPLLTPTPSGGAPVSRPHKKPRQTRRTPTGTGSTQRAPSATSAAPSAAATSRLPATGAEPGELAALGVAIVLAGIGLRLRTAPLRWDR